MEFFKQIYRILIICWTGGLLISTTNAQTTANLTKSQNDQLSTKIHVNITTCKPLEFLDALRLQTQLNFIMDGVSRHGSDGLTFDGSLKDLLDKVAEKYDLKWHLHGGQSVVFEKAFQTNTDIPQINPEEMHRTATEILKYIPAVEPDFDHKLWGRAMFSLYDSLTPVQITQLKSGQPIKQSALDRDQQMLVDKIFESRTYASARAYWELMQQTFVGILRSMITRERPTTQREVDENGLVFINTIPTSSGSTVKLRVIR